MLTVEWDRDRGWGQPHIKPFQNLSLHPASSALHYAVELFEGMKAFRGQDQRVRLFRPLMNMERMCRSAARASLPPFDQLQLLDCIRRLVALDQDWVPHSDSASLYIRPTFIGTEPSLGVSRPSHALLFVILSPVGAYFATGPMGAVGLLAEPRYVRAWLGGVGDCKMGGNYAPTILVQDEAVRAGCQQALWLYGDDHQITEVGTMNIFLFWTDPQGDLELVTPPLNGIILPGVTRQSLLDLGRKWGVPAGGREEGPAARGDAWGSRPPQSPSRRGAGSPELDGGSPLQETDVAAPGLSSPPATPHLPRSPSPGPHEPRQQRTEELPAKAITMDPPGPHRARMSVQEQLERMRRHKEGQRQLEGGRPNPWGSRQGSLRASASRLPLPTHPPNLGPEPTQTHTEPPLRGGHTGGPWGQSPPPLKRDHHRVITLAYTLATKASERSKLITGKIPPEAQMSANLDRSPEPLDAVTNQHVLCTPTLPRGDPEANHVEAEPCGPANRNAAVSANSVQRVGAANQASSLFQAANWALSVPELSNWFSPSPEAANQAAHLSEAANRASPLAEVPHWPIWAKGVPNQTSTTHKASNRVSPPLWAAQKECGDWAPEQRMVGNRDVAKGGCRGRGRRAAPSQVVAYLGEGSQPIRITLLQSSF
ncbi:uncharacterized protein LOC141976680 isoform X2 [Natator depressus]